MEQGTYGAVAGRGGHRRKHISENAFWRNAAQQVAAIDVERCSLDTIVRKLNLTRPALSHCFPNPQKIFDGIVVSITEGKRDHALKCADPANTPTSLLKAVMIVHVNQFESHYWRSVAGSTGYRLRRRLQHAPDVARGHRFCVVRATRNC
jgi:hypothetical protein